MDNKDFITLASERFSVRKYSDKPVSADDIDLILQAGRLAPTAKNLQPQRIITVTETAGREKIDKAARTYGAPCLFLVCADRDEAWKRPFDNKCSAETDAAIVTCHMMLQAADLGLESVWICMFDPDIIKEEFDLPENIEPMNILAVGYEDDSADSTKRPKQRKPLKETAQFEQYHF